MAKVEPIIIGMLNVTGIPNIREIVDDINQSIDQIRNARGERIAQILRELGQEILTDPRMDNQARQETIENLRTLAREASLPSAQRQLGAVKDALASIPSLLSTSLNIRNYFQVHLGDLRGFFGIAG